MNFFSKEKGLIISAISALIFISFGEQLLGDLDNSLKTFACFVWIFVVMLWASFGVVHHAEGLAIRLGEPFGTLILTLSVISIEVILISAVMLTGKDNPTLGRDMMFAVVMIVMNGLVGISLLLGGLRHVEQQYNLQGAGTFLSVLIPLSLLTLVLPNFTQSTSVGTFSTGQMIFVSLATIGLYGAFLAIQTMRHQGFFTQPNSDDTDNPSHDHADFEPDSVPYHTALLIAHMTPIVMLSKSMAKIIDFGLASLSAPVALGGMLVAILVLAPEGMTTVKAALGNQLQRSMNICLGSALATIGLTAPAVLVIGMLTGQKIILGLDGVDTVLLLTTLLVSVVNLSSGRANIIHGVIHLIIFSAYFVLIFD